MPARAGQRRPPISHPAKMTGSEPAGDRPTGRPGADQGFQTENSLSQSFAALVVIQNDSPTHGRGGGSYPSH